MVGRHRSKHVDKLGYMIIKGGGKYYAKCLVCDRLLANTAMTRLKSHRNICELIEKRSRSPSINSLSNLNAFETVWCTSATEDRRNRDVSMKQNGNGNDGVENNINSFRNWETVNVMDVEIVSNRTLSEDSPPPSTSASSHLPSSEFALHSSKVSKFIASSASATNRQSTHGNRSTPSKESESVARFNDNEKTDLNSAVAECIFGCNLPLGVIESTHFKNLINGLRPGSADALPSRKVLSTVLLDKMYDKCIADAIKNLNSNSVLIIDKWKNSSNSTIVVSMLHNSDGNFGFLNAWDILSETELCEKMCEIIYTSIDLAKALYNITVYAVVCDTDNAGVVNKMDNILKPTLWYISYNSHTANLLAESVLNRSCADKVISILKEFKQDDAEKRIINKRGHQIKLCETRLCSYRDAYFSFLDNMQHMKDSVTEFDIKPSEQKIESTRLLYDDEFINEVRDNFETLKLVFQLTDTCQSATCSLADAVEQWLNVKTAIQDKLRSQFDMSLKVALNKYALTAYYLHPEYRNERLSMEYKCEINEFLLENLNRNGIEDLDDYNCNKGIFCTLREKGVVKPFVFWRMVLPHHPNLAELAIKLLQIPASSGHLPRIFSGCSNNDSPVRNSLTSDRSKKLMHVYYTLQILDTDTKNVNIEDDEDATTT